MLECICYSINVRRVKALHDVRVVRVRVGQQRNHQVDKYNSVEHDKDHQVQFAHIHVRWIEFFSKLVIDFKIPIAKGNLKEHYKCGG
jgi:hypothetical protein